MSRALLIVEHDPVIAADLYIQAEDLGYDVLEPVGTVRGALAELADGRVGAALLDCHLMGETSREVADALRARDTRFAYVTGLPDFPTAHPGWPDAPVLRKPLGGRDLDRTLARLMG